MAKLKNQGYSDSFIHEIIEEDGKKEKERVLLPFTRYQNILNAPVVTDSIKDSSNPEFLLVSTEEEEVSDAEIYELFNQQW